MIEADPVFEVSRYRTKSVHFVAGVLNFLFQSALIIPHIIQLTEWKCFPGVIIFLNNTAGYNNHTEQ